MAGPLRRGSDTRAADVVLLAVTDSQIANAAKAVAPGPLVGHCSGATSLAPLGDHEKFSLHPLIAVPRGGAPAFAGAACAIAGSSVRALRFAESVAVALGMRPVHVEDADRVAYHAAAAMASNFLVALEAAAERLAASAGVSRDALIPLVRATVDNWAALGPEQALTGPIARGDEVIVTAHRNAIAERAPELLDCFDALATVTRAVAANDHAKQAATAVEGRR